MHVTDYGPVDINRFLEEKQNILEALKAGKKVLVSFKGKVSCEILACKQTENMLCITIIELAEKIKFNKLDESIICFLENEIPVVVCEYVSEHVSHTFWLNEKLADRIKEFISGKRPNIAAKI